MGYFVRTEGFYDGVRASKNPQYLILSFRVPEVYKGSIIAGDGFTRPNLTLVINSSQWGDCDFMVHGQKYALDLEVRVEPAKENYAARVTFELQKIRDRQQQQVAA